MIMINPHNQPNFKHGAILRPQLSKCRSVQATGQHAYVQTKEGGKQCVDCGNIKTTKERRSWQNTHHKPSLRNISSAH